MPARLVSLTFGLCCLVFALHSQPYAADSLAPDARESLLLTALEAQAASVEAEVLRVKERTSKRKVKLIGKGSGRNLLMRVKVKARKKGPVEEIANYYLPYVRVEGVKGSDLTGTQLTLKRRDGEIWYASWLYRISPDEVDYRALSAYEVLYLRGRYFSVRGIEGSGRVLWEKFFWLE